jgi:hypothetical protein
MRDVMLDRCRNREGRPGGGVRFSMSVSCKERVQCDLQQTCSNEHWPPKEGACAKEA